MVIEWVMRRIDWRSSGGKVRRVGGDSFGAG